MIQPPSPPEKATEYLQELAQYYRELIHYHQQAAILAGQQLVHVEALLGQDTSLPVDQTKSWLLGDSSSNNDCIESQLNTEDKDYYLENYQKMIGKSIKGDEGVESTLNEKDSLHYNDSNSSKNLFTKDSLPTLVELKDFFEKDRGKFLQIDYIVQHFYGQVTQSEKEEIKPLLLEKLKTGGLKHLWSQVPDAPDCWTFTLLDFPEFSNNKGNNPLFPNLKSDALPTTKVAESLSTRLYKIYEVKNIYSDELIEGKDYFRNSIGHYLWTESGVNKLSHFKQELESQKKQKKKQRLSTSENAEPLMLRPYEGLSMEKAIKKLFKSKPGREWTISEVLEEIYGNLSQTKAEKARIKVTRSLSHGQIKGLWRKDKSKIGVYRS